MKRYAILGNCQANAIASTLQGCKEFKETFSFEKVTPIHRISKADHQTFASEILPEIDLFAYQPISEDFRGGGFGFETALPFLSARTKTVSYPSIQFYGYHGSALTFRDLPDQVRRRTLEIFGSAGAELFHFSQLMMAFVKGLPQDEALSVFHEGFDGDGDFVYRRCQQSLHQLKKSERTHNIDAQLHGRIARDFGTRQLFWSPRHPKGELLRDIALVMLDKVGIIPTEDDLVRMQKRDPLKLPQYPMQDFIRTALGLEFEPLSEFRNKKQTLDIKTMIAGYYALYAELGQAEVLNLLDLNFPKLESWLKTRQEFSQ